jgi:hypothetical protein
MCFRVGGVRGELMRGACAKYIEENWYGTWFFEIIENFDVP